MDGIGRLGELKRRSFFGHEEAGEGEGEGEDEDVDMYTRQKLERCWL